MQANFHFFPDLHIFLLPAHSNGELLYSFEAGQSVKHLIEAAGVPHTEVGQIKVNGEVRDFSYQVQAGDRVEVYPPINGTAKPDRLRFVLDNHLGRLAAYLRMLGFDSLYRNDIQDDELARVSEEEQRILLTRDRHLLMRRAVTYGYCLRSQNPREQLDEVVRRYQLADEVHPFQRCLRCNTPLVPISKEMVMDRLQPLTQQYFEDFHICPNCSQIYWKGSHYEHMLAIIDQIRL